MFYVYNADRKDGKKDSFIFKHLGSSPVAAAERIESMFAHQENSSMNDDLSVNIHDLAYRVIGTKSLEQHLHDFCEHTRQFHISEYALDVKRPLRLKDLWEDDPIGSGGPDIVDEEQLTGSEKMKLGVYSPHSKKSFIPHIFSR